MLEILVLCSFAVLIIVCLSLHVPLFLALCGGFGLFFDYGLYRGHSYRTMLHVAGKGRSTVRTVAMTMALVGMLTALWRMDGTIAYIVYHVASLFHPAIILGAVFLLCALVSVLTGTSFGATATMGIICMTITNSMNIDAMFAGGAILSGVYVGDRCSPISTSALCSYAARLFRPWLLSSNRYHPYRNIKYSRPIIFFALADAVASDSRHCPLSLPFASPSDYGC